MPNVVLIVADDLGYGDLGCYGQRVVRTPNLDRMATEGLRFTHTYAGSTVCAPSRCVLMTGLHTGHCTIRGNSQLVALGADELTVAKLFKKAGYRTALIGKWGLGEAATTGIPTRQGFDEFFGYLNQHHAHNYYPTFLWRNEQKVHLRNVVPNEDAQGGGKASVRIDYSHDLFITEALRFIKSNCDRPFFLYLALTIPHANNEAREDGMEVPDYGLYETEPWPKPEKGFAAMISRMDGDIGRVLGLLRQLDLAHRTLVIFTSDNGPHREGGHDPDFFDSNGPLRGYKRDLYEGGIRVPAIAWWPGVIPAGVESNEPWWFADLMPTVADILGEECPAGVDGVSILPILLDPRAKLKRSSAYFYWEFYERGGARALYWDGWKAVEIPWGGTIELYRLATDIGEKNNVASQFPEIVHQVRKMLELAHLPDPRWRIPSSRR